MSTPKKLTKEITKELTKKIKCPKGFLLSTAGAAIKKPGRTDMALIYSERDAVSAAAFTTNRVKGAPVRLCMERIKSGGGGKARAIIVNSGNSNVSTGPHGLKDAREMTAITAKQLGIPERLVYVSSTGVIGVPMPMDRIRKAIPLLASGLGTASPVDAARAIMTTDTFPKTSMRRIKIGDCTGTIVGIAKGAGMIAPNMNMATMLAFFLTDIAVGKNILKKAFMEAVDFSFNRITIDGDMSTSDTAFIMANGMAGNKEINAGSRHYETFKKALCSLAYELSKMIVKDGEGATKLIEVEVRGAKTEKDARRAAFAVANSSLVKTAVYGADANWGRVMCSIGYSGANMREEKTDIYFNGIKIVSRGVSTGKEKKAKKLLKHKEIRITVDLNMGGSKANVLTCDLTEDYVRVNAEYTT